MLKSGMRLWRTGNAILSLALLIGQAASQDCTYTDTTTFATELLCSHNGYRARHQAGSLIYNDTMAAAAAAYTEQCIFEHPSLDQQGSNLAAGFSNPYDAVDAWYLEVVDPGYNFSAPGPQDGTLHFTQMVWNGSTQLGCGAYNCNGANNVPGWYIACYYYTEGNVVLYGNPGYFFELNVFQNTSEADTSRFSCPDTPTSCPTTTSATSTAAATSTVAQGTTAAASSTAINSSGAGNAASSSTSSLSTSVMTSATSLSTTTYATPTNQGGSTGSATVITTSGTTLTVAPVVPTIIPVGTSTGSGYSNSSATTTRSGLDSTTLITLSSASTISSSTPSSSTSTGIVGPAATTIQLVVLATSSSKKRQTTSTLYYVKSDGTITTDSSQAASFTLSSGQLYYGSELFSTNPGTASEIFAASTSTGSITTTFALVNNILEWTNSAFTINGNNQAQLAISASTLYAAFSTLPAGATAVQATAVAVGSTTSTPTTTASSSSGQYSLSNTVGPNYSVITSIGPTSQTVITATQPTTISTDGAVFIIHATGATNANGATGAPTATALPACPTNVVQPSVVRIGGGAVNVIMPDFYGRM